MNPGKGRFSENKYDEIKNLNLFITKISKKELAGLTSRNVSSRMKGYNNMAMGALIAILNVGCVL